MSGYLVWILDSAPRAFFLSKLVLDLRCPEGEKGKSNWTPPKFADRMESAQCDECMVLIYLIRLIATRQLLISTGYLELDLTIPSEWKKKVEITTP